MKLHSWQEANVSRLAVIIGTGGCAADTSGTGAGKTVMAAIAQDVFPDVKVTLQNADGLLIANYHYETFEK